MTRLAFLGTPDAAVPSLEALAGAGHSIALVVSRPDRRRGRGSATSPSPVKQAALRLGLAVTDRLEEVMDAGIDLGVVVAYGRIIPAAVLERVPMVNLHFSLLPRWRGAAPVERAILAGDRTTGVCLMNVEEGLDTGPVLARLELPIGPEETAEELRARLAVSGADLLVQGLQAVLAGGPGALPEPEPQSGEVTYAAKIEPGERMLHWERSAEQLGRIVRIGGAHSSFRGRRLRVLRAVPTDGEQVGTVPTDGAQVGAVPTDSGGPVPDGPGTLVGTTVMAGTGALVLVQVQPEGSRPMAAADWLRGARPAEGERLGD